MTVAEIITAIIGLLGAGGVAGGLLAWMRYRKQDRAQADKTAAEAWAILAERQASEIERLCQRVEALEQNDAAKSRRIDELKQSDTEKVRRIGELEEEIKELRDWIKKQGLTPPPRGRGEK